MCGLVGITGKLTFADEALMRRLLTFDYFRGPDSTGFAAMRKNGDSKIAKIASHPFDLFDLKRFSDALNFSTSLVFLGHNRFSTRGKTNNVNAHPYEYDHITGAHNGTLEKSSWEALNKKLGEDTDVDSKAIIQCIARFGIEETVPLLEGAWALTWFDSEERTMNFLRNDERTLWYATSADFKKVFWASEYKIIDLARYNSVSTNDVQELYKNDKGNTYFMFEEDYLYSIPVDDLEKGYTKLPDFKGKKLKGLGGTPTVVPFGSRNMYSGGKTNYTYKEAKRRHGTTSTTTSHSFSKPKTVAKLNLEMTGSRTNPFGNQKYVEDVDFHTLAINGCSWCKDMIDFEEPGLTLYTERDLVLCPNCGTNHEHQTKLYVKDVVVT